ARLGRHVDRTDGLEAEALPSRTGHADAEALGELIGGEFDRLRKYFADELLALTIDEPRRAVIKPFMHRRFRLDGLPEGNVMQHDLGIVDTSIIIGQHRAPSVGEIAIQLAASEGRERHDAIWARHRLAADAELCRLALPAASVP